MKRAEQSTTLDYEGVRYSADRAIDGNLSSQSRTSLTTNSKWLKVYFNDTIGVRVGKVFVKKAYGHASCEYYVYVLNNAELGETPSVTPSNGYCGKYSASMEYNKTVGCEGRNGTGVMIHMSCSNPTQNSLNIFEIQVFEEIGKQVYYFTSNLVVL